MPFGNIRLLDCESGLGDNYIAQQLADELNVEILAPTDLVHIYLDGEMFVGSSSKKRDGNWILIKPRSK